MEERIVERIERLKPGKGFVPKDFLDIATRGSIDVALGKMAKAGMIRRVRRGLYDLPRTSELLGTELSPDLAEAAEALARRFHWKIVPAGAWAANLLGLSTQVPARAMYLSDGPSREVAVGERVIVFKHARPSRFASGTGKAGLVVQALRYLGSENVDAALAAKIRGLLTPVEMKQLVKTTLHDSEWIHLLVKRIAEGDL